MTARLRILLAWILLAALPLQGFAAVSMRLCHPAPAASVLLDSPAWGHTVTDAAPASEPQAFHRASRQAGHGDAAHDHAAHDHSTHPAGHGPVSHAAAADAPNQYAAASHDAALGHSASTLDGPDGHRCSTCASCGHVIALSMQTAVAAPRLAPPPLPAEPVARLVTRGLPVPDKPPRA